MTAPLTDEQKNDLVEQSKGIVFYMANKYRNFDPEFDELVGWSYLGLAMAIDEYCKDDSRPLAKYAFPKIKKTILEHYLHKRIGKKAISTNTVIFTGKNGDEITLENSIPDESGLGISDMDIVEIINKSISNESELFRKIVIDSLIYEQSAKELSIKYKLSERKIMRMTRRGKTLIRVWLQSNDMISDSMITENENNQLEKSKRKIQSFSIEEDDLKKIKYLRREFIYLDNYDIANILGLSPYDVSMLLSSPTTDYLWLCPDDSIKDKALAYCKEEYPDRLPGELIVYKIAAEAAG